jgi:poly(3-hydroxybutyrate) depolymerase
MMARMRIGAIGLVGISAIFGCRSSQQSSKQFPATCDGEQHVFQDRTYRICNASHGSKPRTLLIYLHGIAAGDPYEVERGTSKQLELWARSQAAVLLMPQAQLPCTYLKPPKPNYKCWGMSENGSDIRYINELVAHVEQQSGKFSRKEVIGYSNGAYFLAKAYQQGALAGYDLVGLVAGGAPWSGEKMNSSMSLPELWVEIAKEDSGNAPWQRKLIAHLPSLGVGKQLHFHEVPGGHVYNEARVATFLRWIHRQE